MRWMISENCLRRRRRNAWTGIRYQELRSFPPFPSRIRPPGWLLAQKTMLKEIFADKQLDPALLKDNIIQQVDDGAKTCIYFQDRFLETLVIKEAEEAGRSPAMWIVMLYCALTLTSCYRPHS